MCEAEGNDEVTNLAECCNELIDVLMDTDNTLANPRNTCTLFLFIVIIFEQRREFINIQMLIQIEKTNKAELRTLYSLFNDRS